MPSIETNRRNFEAAKEQGNIVPVEKSVVINPTPPIPTYPAAPNANLRTPLPAISVQQPDMQRQWQTGATPQQRISPPSVNSNPVAGAQAASQTVILRATDSGLVLETNNIKNNSQNVLNLLAGSNVILSADSQGGVTITGTAGGDGLTHGDAVWEHDSAYVELRDEFTTGAVGTATPPGVGELEWAFGFGSGSVVANYIPGIPPNLGQFEFFQTSATADTVAYITPGNSAAATIPAFFDGATAYLDTPGWKLTWVFCFRRPYNPNFAGAAAFSLAKSSTYLGLAFRIAASVGALFTIGRPEVFMGVRYDTDTTAPSIADTTFWLEACFNPVPNFLTRNNIQGTNGGAFDTGITPVEGTFYRLDMVYTASGSLTMSLNGGGSSASHTFTVTPMVISYTPTGIPVNANGVTNTKLTPTAYSTTDGYIPLSPDSTMAMAGWVSTNTPLNITTKIYQQTNGATLYIPTPALFVTPSATVPAVTVTAFPAMFPAAIHGNDSQGTAPNTGRGLVLDFFSFVWNKGLTGTTTNPTQSRYW